MKLHLIYTIAILITILSFKCQNKEEQLEEKKVEEIVEKEVVEEEQVFEPQDGPGYVTKYKSKFMWSESEETFVPNYVMLGDNKGIYLNTVTQSTLDEFLDEMFDKNGFNGVHVPVYGQWFHIGNYVVAKGDKEIDQRTFDQLEMIIRTVYKRGGTVYIWAWGDDQRSWSPASLAGGIMGAEEKKVWDKVYAQLNDLKGWTIGYGFDLWEWVNADQLKAWKNYCYEKTDWRHLLGARAQKNEISQIYDGLDFNAYENHKPRYDAFVQMLDYAGSKPAFSGDRFRVRGRAKDPSPEESLHIIWDATMAGGVAGIWGYLGSEEGISRSYPNAEQLLCYSTFWKNRFLKDLERDNSGTNGYGLRNGSNNYIYYKENTDSLTYSLSGDAKKVIAVDCKKAYAEIEIGIISNGSHTFEAPYASDWALAIGTF